MARNRNGPAQAESFSADDLQDLDDGRMILRCVQRDRYVVLIQTTIRDTQLSFKARGILAFLLSFPDTWKFNLKHIESCSDKDGRDSIASGIKELINQGYARRVTTRAPNGQIESKELQVAETPLFRQLTPAEKPETGFPAQVPTTTPSPETDFPVQAETPPQTDFPEQAEPPTALPEPDFPEQVNPHLLSNEDKNPEFKKTGRKETPQTPQASAPPHSAQAVSAAAGGEESEAAAKKSSGPSWSLTGVGEWLERFRQATPEEIDFVLGELAKKAPDEVKVPNAYADRCLKSYRADEAQRRVVQQALADTEEPVHQLCDHGSITTDCAHCRDEAETAKAKIQEILAVLATKKSA